MSKLSYVLLLVSLGAASTQLAQAHGESQSVRSLVQQGVGATPTLNPTVVPTVAVPQGAPAAVPTVSLPLPAPPHRPKHNKHKHPAKYPTPVPQNYVWISAFLTSYCPGTAGWISSSGQAVFYGMLANDFYPFGTRVYLPVLGMTGVVEDRFGGGTGWNYFDVWSPICYGTPTGWFKVGIVQ